MVVLHCKSGIIFIYRRGRQHKIFSKGTSSYGFLVLSYGGNNASKNNTYAAMMYPELVAEALENSFLNTLCSKHAFNTPFQLTQVIIILP
jgi:hypothetical protein